MQNKINATKLLNESLIVNESSGNFRYFVQQTDRSAKPVARYRLMKKVFDEEKKIEGLQRCVVIVQSDGSIKFEYTDSDGNERPRTDDFVGKDVMQDIKQSLSARNCLPHNGRDGIEWYDRRFFDNDYRKK